LHLANLPQLPMNLVYVDAHTLNPGDLSWKPILSLGSVTVYPRTAPDELVERVIKADTVLTNKVRFSRATLEQLPNLRYIGVTATGYDIIDIAAARELGITVTNVRGYSTDFVAQHTFALLLELTQHVGRHSQSVAAGDWVQSPDFSYAKTPLVELAGKTLGIVGYGEIGKKVAAIGRAFGMNILVNRANPNPTDGVAYVDLPTLFSQSDVVSLHCPMTAANRAFVNNDLLRQMKLSAFLINTARGGLLNEADLAQVLNENRIAGTALDVLSSEPPTANNPLLTAKNCLITPHIAWASREARQRLMEQVCANVRAFWAGEVINSVQ
jgi:glycerate dehydrogenase